MMENMENKMMLNEEELNEVNGGAMPKQNPGAGMQWYCIQTGDRLSHLAKRFHTTVQTLVNINTDRRGIKNADTIYAGFWIRVPV